MPTLLMMTATGETRQVPLQPHDNKIGRGPTNDVVVDSSQASRDHAVIDVEQAFVTITDLSSRNGTFVNEVRIESQVLVHGDAAIHDERLHLPHPRIAERAFVLLPLADLDPAYTIRGQGTVANLLETLGTQGCEPLP